MVKAVVFDDYAPKVDCIDKSRDRATDISPWEGYGVPKANVVKEEMQSRSAFEECVNAFITDDELEWREETRATTTLTALVQHEPVARPEPSIPPK